MASRHVLFGFIFGGFRSVVEESEIRIAKPTGILKNPGSQGGQARPRDSGAAVHFEPALSDITEGNSSAAASSPRDGSSPPMIRASARLPPRTPESEPEASNPPIVEAELVAEVRTSPLGRLMGFR